MKTVSPAVAFAVACVGIAFFSCMDAVMKGLSIALGAYNAMLWRSIVGIAMSGPLWIALRGRWPDRARLRLHVQRSTAAALSVLLFFWGLVRVPMAEGVALTFLAPIIATLLAALLLGERVRRSAILASLLAFSGVIVIAWARAGEGGGPEALQGAAAIVFASVFYAYNLVLLRQSALLAGPVEITFFTNVVFGGFYALLAPGSAILSALLQPIVAVEPLAMTVPAAHHLPMIALAAALALFSSVLLAWAYARAEAQILVSVEYTAFIWSAILGAIVFGEAILPLTVLGAGMIVGGCLIAARREKEVPVVHTEAAL